MMKKIIVLLALFALGFATNMRMTQDFAEEEALLTIATPPAGGEAEAGAQEEELLGESPAPEGPFEANEPEILYSNAPLAQPEPQYGQEPTEGQEGFAEEPTEGQEGFAEEPNDAVMDYDEDDVIEYAYEEPVLGGWSDLSEDRLSNDDELRGILAYGVNKILEAAIADGSLAPQVRDYSLLKVNRAKSQVVSGMNYDFSVTYGNGQDRRVTISFEVYDQPWTNTRQLSNACFRSETLVRV